MISGSKAMDWNFQSVKYFWANLCNYMVEEKAGVEKQNSKKGWRFEKNEHACSVDSEEFCGLSVFKGGLHNSENSKLVKAPTVPKLTSRNPRHSSGAHWYRYLATLQSLPLPLSLLTLFVEKLMQPLQRPSETLEAAKPKKPLKLRNQKKPGCKNRT